MNNLLQAFNNLYGTSDSSVDVTAEDQFIRALSDYNITERVAGEILDIMRKIPEEKLGLESVEQTSRDLMQVLSLKLQEGFWCNAGFTASSLEEIESKILQNYSRVREEPYTLPFYLAFLITAKLQIDIEFFLLLQGDVSLELCTQLLLLYWGSLAVVDDDALGHYHISGLTMEQLIAIVDSLKVKANFASEKAAVMDALITAQSKALAQEDFTTLYVSAEQLCDDVLEIISPLERDYLQNVISAYTKAALDSLSYLGGFEALSNVWLDEYAE